MKKTLLTLFLSLCCLPVLAQYRDSESLRERLQWGDEKLHILLDMRFDVRYDMGLRDGDEFAFKGQSLRLWLEGEIIPGIRYRLRHRLNKSQVPQQDGLADATDHAWIALDFGGRKEWTVTIGKQSVQLGTYEYDYNPADVYFSTMVNSDFDGHKVGVNVAYRFLGQVINLQLFNSSAPQFATHEYRNKAAAGSVLWQGILLGGALRTRWAYTVLQHSSDKVYNWVTAGVQINAGKFRSEIDYYFGDRDMDYSGVIGDLGERPVRDQSAAVNLKYNLGKWRPFIKGIWNNRRDRGMGADAYHDIGAHAMVEFYPFLGHKYVGDLRFHLGYGYTHTTFEGPWSDTPALDQHTVIAGVRWFFNAK